MKMVDYFDVWTLKRQQYDFKGSKYFNIKVQNSISANIFFIYIKYLSNALSFLGPKLSRTGKNCFGRA